MTAMDKRIDQSDQPGVTAPPVAVGYSYSRAATRRPGRLLTTDLPMTPLPALRIPLLLLALAAPPLAAQDVLSLSLEELAHLPVTGATGFALPLDEVPATTVVLRQAQWEAMGAQSVYDVLELVPGLHVTEVGRSFRQVVARGLFTSNNSQVLWLLDGKPLNELGAGGPPQAFDKGLAGLERIEVIRGPVSVIHGSNAFAAVINLVSQAAGTPGSRVAVKGGSFDARAALAETGGAQGDWRWRLSLEGRRSEGDPDRVIRRDIQDTFDALFGSKVARTPGVLPSDDDIEDAQLRLEWRQSSLQAWHYRNDAGARLSNEILDPASRNGVTIQHLVLAQAGDLSGLQTRWELEGLLQRQEQSVRSARAPGAVLPIGVTGDIDFAGGTPVTFAEGAIAEQTTAGERRRIGLNFINRSWARHTLRLGLGREWQTLRERESRRNFGAGILAGSPPVVPLTPLPNLAGTPLSQLPDSRRHLTFVALQDDWRLADTLQLNLGLRHDRYSDFGTTTNPRASLQWQALPATRLRLGYGTAFRAPSFSEQYFRNNPSILGNPDLDPEELRSAEFSVEQTLSPALQIGLYVFHQEARHLIDYATRPPAVGLVAQNIDRREGQGGTLELTWQPQPGARLNASHTLWDVHDRSSGNVPFVPRQMTTLNGWWEFTPRWTLGGNLKRVAGREREAGDPRAAIGDNTWANLHLHTTALSPRLRLGLTVQNLVDADLRDPLRSYAGLGPTVPDDLPLAGRQWLLEAVYRWGGSD